MTCGMEDSGDGVAVETGGAGDSLTAGGDGAEGLKTSGNGVVATHGLGCDMEYVSLIEDAIPSGDPTDMLGPEKPGSIASVSKASGLSMAAGVLEMDGVLLNWAR